MGIFNQHSNNQPQQQSFLRGLRGSPGVGFSLTSDRNYDMNNKKLKNVGEGVESSDAVTKHQVETEINSKINSSPSLNNFVKKDSPEVAADLDMKGFAIKNMKVTPADDASATSRKNVDGKLNTKADKSVLSQYIKRDGSVQMVGGLQMNGNRITGLTNVPYYNGEAANIRYVDDKVNVKADTRDLNNKADKSDLDDYLKLDGTKPMQGNINMNNTRITRLPDPQLADEPVTRKFLANSNTLFYNIFLDLDGNSKMRGNIKMNDKRITGLTNLPNADDEATNKKYVDDNISKSNIKPSHTPKNVFQYLMDDVNEWSSEYYVKVENFFNLAESPHSWDKRVLNITPVTISGILLVITGTITGGLTLNPIILGVINGFGILLTDVGKMKNYKKKMEMLKIAFTTYEKVLVELRSALRGDEFDKDRFIDKMKIIDEMIIDQTPLADKYEKKYKEKHK